jgi:hypothetical protein
MLLIKYEKDKFESARLKFHNASHVAEASYVESELFKSSVDVPRYSSYKKEFANLYQDEVFNKPDSGIQKMEVPVFNPVKLEENQQMEFLEGEPNDKILYNLMLSNEENTSIPGSFTIPISLCRWRRFGSGGSTRSSREDSL